MDRSDLRDQLLDAGILLPGGAAGVYGRSQRFEEIVSAVDRHGVERLASPADEVLRFPPVLVRSVLERSDYVRSFPHLLGAVHTFDGDDRAHAALLATVDAGEDWTAGLSSTGLVLAATACHAVYPLCSGTLPDGGRRFDVAGWCFRHEPSADPARLQSFRMHEWVVVGGPEEAALQRDEWVLEAAALLHALGLPVEPVVANDPFFGRGGRMLAANQREEGHKIELVMPVGAGAPVAVASCNSHLDHFGGAFDIATAEGAVAHSARVGLGLERIAVALLATHGTDTAEWPASVQERLWQ